MVTSSRVKVKKKNFRFVAKPISTYRRSKPDRRGETQTLSQGIRQYWVHSYCPCERLLLNVVPVVIQNKI